MPVYHAQCILHQHDPYITVLLPPLSGHFCIGLICGVTCVTWKRECIVGGRGGDNTWPEHAC